MLTVWFCLQINKQIFRLLKGFFTVKTNANINNPRPVGVYKIAVSWYWLLQLDESVFGVSAILMVYVRYSSKIKGNVIEEFLFGKYLETDEQEETVFRCLQKCLSKYDIPLENIIAIATDSASATVGRYRGVLLYFSNKKCSVYVLFIVCCTETTY